MRRMTTDWRRLSLPVRSGIAVLVGIVVVGLLAVWILPAILARHPSEGMSAAEQLRAANDVRAPLVGFVVALGAAGTLWFTAHTYTLNREGQVTDRYTRAVGQLGDESSPVRVGGICALERIADDSARDRTTIVYVLGSFVRERSKGTRAREDEAPEDAQTALKVAGRLLRRTTTALDLRDADLRNCDLSGIPDTQVLLDRAELDGAVLPGA